METAKGLGDFPTAATGGLAGLVFGGPFLAAGFGLGAVEGTHAKIDQNIRDREEQARVNAKFKDSFKVEIPPTLLTQEQIEQLGQNKIQKKSPTEHSIGVSFPNSLDPNKTYISSSHALNPNQASKKAIASARTKAQEKQRADAHDFLQETINGVVRGTSIWSGGQVARTLSNQLGFGKIATEALILAFEAFTGVSVSAKHKGEDMTTKDFMNNTTQNVVNKIMSNIF